MNKSDATSIDDLKVVIANKNHPNQFDFILTTPSGMSNLPTPPDGAKSFRLFGKSLSVPSITSENQISRIMTILRGTALGVSYDSFILTFYDTKTLFFHRLFNFWLTGRLNTNGALQYYPDEYQGEITISTHDTDVYVLENIYPISVGDFRLDNELVDQYGTFDVTFFVTKVTPIDAGF